MLSELRKRKRDLDVQMEATRDRERANKRMKSAVLDVIHRGYSIAKAARYSKVGRFALTSALKPILEACAIENSAQTHLPIHDNTSVHAMNIDTRTDVKHTYYRTTNNSNHHHPRSKYNHNTGIHSVLDPKVASMCAETLLKSSSELTLQVKRGRRYKMSMP